MKMVDGVEIELQKYNVDELEELIEELRSQPTGGNGTGSLCDNLRKELLKQQGISLPTIIQLSYNYRNGVILVALASKAHSQQIKSVYFSLIKYCRV
jgi:hypothetical protein